LALNIKVDFMKRTLLLFWALVCFTLLNAQDRAYVRKIVRDLSSPAMHGRGYVKSGDTKAAIYLEKEMKKAGLLSFNNDFVQRYTFSINTFPGQLTLRAGGKKLRPGHDFVVAPTVTSLDQTFRLMWIPDTVSTIESAIKVMDTAGISQCLAVAPSRMQSVYRSGFPGARGVIQLTQGNVWWHVSGAREPDNRVSVMIRESALPVGTSAISLKAENKYLVDHEARNLIGYVRGSAEPDTFLVFIAHYDHLGRMGSRTLFPGASDNASGTATVLDLARHYASNTTEAYYSMAFILVSGEEAGLLGSFYNADNPLFPLENIKFLINMDMVGTGSEGLSIVNGNQFPEAVKLFKKINSEKGYFADIRSGGESCNSDHCPYYRKGVPSVFLFTRGDENREYHNIYDTHERLPFTSYEQLFGIITDFSKALQPDHSTNR
jgi:hypothetical protein